MGPRSGTATDGRSRQGHPNPSRHCIEHLPRHLSAAAWAAAPAAVEVSFSYATDEAAVVRPVDTAFTINLQLRETLTGGSASILALEDGLPGAGVRATCDGLGAATDPTDVSAIGRAASLVDGSGTSSAATGEAPFSGSVSLTATEGARPVSLGGGVSQVLLGTHDLRTGLVAGESTSFTIGRLNAANGNTATFPDVYGLDVTPPWRPPTPSPRPPQ